MNSLQMTGGGGYFGRASDQPHQSSDSNWGNLDNFDVDLLAEYLLDDNNDGTMMSGGDEVTFDFK
jgi:hypothetical protein